MHAAVWRIYIVRKGKFAGLDVVYIKEGDLDIHALVLFLGVEYLFLKRLLIAGKILHEGLQTALEIKAVVRERRDTLVEYIDAHASCEVGLLAKVVDDLLLVEIQRRRKYLFVRKE